MCPDVMKWDSSVLQSNILNKDNSLIRFTNDRIIHDKRYGIDNSKLEKLGFKLKKYDKNKLINLLKIYIDTKIK